MKVSGKRFWSPKKRATAVVLRQESYTYQEIATRIGGDKSGVRRLCLKFEQSGKVTDRPRSGRRKVTTPQDDRQIVRMVLKDRKTTSRDISRSLETSGVQVSARTIRKRLCAVGLKARIPRKKPFLNVAQRRKRVMWAKQHMAWTPEQWGRVMFSDETRISIFGSDGVHYIRRRKGEENLPQCTTPTMKHPLSIMVWGCMSGEGVGRLQVCNGMINARMYIDDILEKKVLQSATDMFGGDHRDFIFQQDGAPCHTAKICTKWFDDHNVNVLDWPGNSPDLNPIENLWARLKRLVSAKRPSNKAQLTEAVISSWFHTITLNELKALVNSMPRRCQAVIKCRGYPSKY
jgi:transposase